MKIQIKIAIFTSIFSCISLASPTFNMRYTRVLTPTGDTLYSFKVENGSPNKVSYVTLGADELAGTQDLFITDTNTGELIPGITLSAPSPGWKVQFTPVDESNQAVIVWSTDGNSIISGGSQLGFGVIVPKGSNTNVSKCHFTLMDDKALHYAKKVSEAPTSDTGTFTITTSIIGLGSVTLGPNQPSYAAGSTVLLTPIPAKGYTFIGWTGDTTTTTQALSLTVTRNRFLTAKFQVNATPTYSLAVTARDETPTDSIYIRPRIIIQNVGTNSAAIGGFNFFFTTTPGKTSILNTWFSPKCKAIITKVNQKDAVTFTCTNLVLGPGAVYPDNAGTSFGVHNSDWSSHNRSLDWSEYGLGINFTTTNRVTVTDTLGQVISGNAP